MKKTPYITPLTHEHRLATTHQLLDSSLSGTNRGDLDIDNNPTDDEGHSRRATPHSVWDDEDLSEE